MNKKELLRMIVDLQERVTKLEKDAGKNIQYPWISPAPIFQPYIQTIADPCTDGGYHNYPNPWNGTIPPNCNKCGKQGPSFTITCGTVDSSSDGAVTSQWNRVCSNCHPGACNCGIGLKG